MRSYSKEKQKILTRIRESKDFFLMSDFDGTLAPIVNDPQKARMSNTTKRLLQDIAKSHRIAIISGRALNDVKKKVGMSHLIYAGNHGNEWDIGKHYAHATMNSGARAALVDVKEVLQPLARTYRGLSIEDKGFTLSVHYRAVSPSLHLRCVNDVMLLFTPFKKRGLVIEAGKKTLNIFPKKAWTKGTFVQHALTLIRKKDILPIYMGDEITDEHAFRALPQGITIHVGPIKKSAAKYFFKNRQEVDDFLKELRSIT